MRALRFIRKYGKWLFVLASAAVVGVFLYASNNLVQDLSARERERMEIWADATREIQRWVPLLTSETENQAEADSVEIVEMTDDAFPAVDIDFLVKILEGNTTIPVILVDNNGKIRNFRNFDLPEQYDSNDPNPENLSAKNKAYLYEKLEKMRKTPNVIDVEVSDGVKYKIYYEDSTLLKRLGYYPYIQLAVMLVFLIVVYYAVVSAKKAEQNKVWVGLSKETAHQLGTPISSLMAWLELLPEMGADEDTCHEMSKDVKRLETIASRFSKIGSVPAMETLNVGELVNNASEYMASRISARIDFSRLVPSESINVSASAPLFGWVMENLIKNAVDAMEGHGSLTITVGSDARRAWIEVTDTGKGISRKNHKNVFRPGFTTKKRGWGLGLTLAKRIVEEYHHGKIYVKDSVPGRGTTFRIELPTV